MKTKNNYPKLKAENRQLVIEALTKYLAAELEYDLSNLQAELMVDWLDEKIGRHYYNQGVMDTRQLMRDKVEDAVLLLKEE